MKKRYYTFFVLANDTTKARQFRLPVNAVKAVAASLAVFFIAVALVAFDYVRVKQDTSELDALRSENTAQRIELQGITARLKAIETQVSGLGIFDKKLRVMANLDDKSVKGAEKVMGMGGPSPDEDIFRGPGASVSEMVKGINSELDALDRKVKAQESSFTELQQQFIKRSSMLASTPSIWPVRGWVTSSYGQRVSPFTSDSQHHKGVDIANNVGAPVVASADGVVVASGWDDFLGKNVTIRHGYGMKTIYGHLSAISVKTGQRVKRGEKVGLVGNTGRSTGPHLHYEVTVNGLSVNPMKYMLN